MILTFYDTETSGLNTYYDDVLQLAYIRFDTQKYEVIDANSMYLWEPGFRYSEEAAKVHGITKEFLESLPIEEMPNKYQRLHTIFNRGVIAGYNNTSFDDNLLCNFLKRHSIEPVIDLSFDVRTAYCKKHNTRKGKLMEACATEGIPTVLVDIMQKKLFNVTTAAHDASYDVTATYLLYTKMGCDAING